MGGRHEGRIGSGKGIASLKHSYRLSIPNYNSSKLMEIVFSSSVWHTHLSYNIHSCTHAFANCTEARIRLGALGPLAALVHSCVLRASFQHQNLIVCSMFMLCDRNVTAKRTVGALWFHVYSVSGCGWKCCMLFTNQLFAYLVSAL